VTPRTRIVAFGSAALLVLAGGVCAAVVGGVTGEVLTIVLVSGGLVVGLLLIFLEIGLDEERDIAREQASRRERAESGTGKRRAVSIRRRASIRRPPRRPG
jgi:hypothetical protein